jgi:hypothetical protein
MSTTRTLIVQCKRQASDYARLSLSASYLIIEYGIYITDDQFKVIDTETLWLQEFPELRTLHDGRGWNIEAVFSTVACVSGFHYEADGETEVRLPDLLKRVQQNKRAE